MNAIPQDEHEAVEMAVDYEFDINQFPPSLRDIFPEKFVDATKTPGKKLTKLKKGEQGLRVQTNETLQLSRCTFERDHEAVEYIVPTSMLKVGAKQNTFRSLAPAVQIQSASTRVHGSTALERFVRTFWVLARQQRSVLTSLGWNPSRRDRLFGDATFASNVDAIMNAFTPQARATLSDPNPATIAMDMLRGLVPITASTPTQMMIYVRLYTKASPDGSLEDISVYGGKCSKPATRRREHEDSTKWRSSHHYRVARRYPEDRRMMLEIMHINGFDADLTAMAEETVIAMFRSYAGWHFRKREDNHQAWVLESSRAEAMTKIADDSCASAGFPRLKWTGCNTAVPIFLLDSAGRAWMRASTPATPYQPEMHRYTTGFVFPSIWVNPLHRSAQVWLDPHIDFKINKKVIDAGNFQQGQVCSLVFEVVANKTRHPDPYIVVPDVGVYENYHEASCMAIYIESFDEASRKWKRTRCYHQKPLNRLEANSAGGHDYVPEAYVQVKRILQLLEGTQWTSTTDDFPRLAYNVASMVYAEYDHLRQTIEMVKITHPRATKPLPKRMSFQENANLMFKLYPELIIGPSERPDKSLLLPATPMTYKQANATKCDFCLALNQDRSSPYQCDGSTRQCDLCRLYLNRPCTWTDRATVKLWQKENDPHHLFIGPAKLPTCEEIAEPVGSRLLIESLAGDEAS